MEIKVIDSHTGGEPTRVVVDGWPEVQGSTMAAKLKFLKENHDHIRQAVVCEPRGHDAVVGALLTEPVNEGSTAGVVFFNDVGYLGMCGHASIGLVETLKHLNRIKPGQIFLDTPVGKVSVLLEADGNISVSNIEPRVMEKDFAIEVPGVGNVIGDISYGGNWFFLVNNISPELKLSNLDKLMSNSKAIRSALEKAGVTGDDGHKIDHIEFFSTPENADAHSRNFVLCPGNAYDRSPCGTGTSAKMACLYERGILQIGETWIQESITGSLFECRLELKDGKVAPLISSNAFVTSSATLFFNEKDPFCWGIS